MPAEDSPRLDRSKAASIGCGLRRALSPRRGGILSTKSVSTDHPGDRSPAPSGPERPLTRRQALAAIGGGAAAIGAWSSGASALAQPMNEPARPASGPSQPESAEARAVLSAIEPLLDATESREEDA